ncbi:hypothetical protein KCU61_g199, partial [Aureobasidium melanogenum]
MLTSTLRRPLSFPNSSLANSLHSAHPLPTQEGTLKTVSRKQRVLIFHLLSAEPRVLSLDIFFTEPLHGSVVDDERVLATITSVAGC